MHAKLEQFVETGVSDLPVAIIVQLVEFLEKKVSEGWHLLQTEMRLFHRASLMGGSADLVLQRARPVSPDGKRVVEISVWDYKHKPGLSTESHGFAPFPAVGPVSALQEGLRQVGVYAAMIEAMSWEEEYVPVEVGVLALHEHKEAILSAVADIPFER